MRTQVQRIPKGYCARFIFWKGYIIPLGIRPIQPYRRRYVFLMPANKSEPAKQLWAAASELRFNPPQKIASLFPLLFRQTMQQMTRFMPELTLGCLNPQIKD